MAAMATRCIVALIAATTNAATHTRQSFKSSFISLGGVKHHVRDTGEVSADGPVAILLHGFAGSAFNCWRSTLPALAACPRDGRVAYLVRVGETAETSVVAARIGRESSALAMPGAGRGRVLRDSAPLYLRGTTPVILGASSAEVTPERRKLSRQNSELMASMSKTTPDLSKL